MLVVSALAWLTSSWKELRNFLMSNIMFYAVSQRKKEEPKEPLNRKERRNLKKRKRKNYDLISRTLQLWEKLRRYGNILPHTCTHRLYAPLYVWPGAYEGRSVQLRGTAFESERLRHFPFMDIFSSGA